MGKINAAVPLLFILTTACFAVLPANAASARTLVVPDSYSSIAQAVADATDGDTIYVKNGVYAEYSLSIDKAISLVGENAQTTVINLDSPRHEEEMNIIFTHIWHDPALTVNCDNFALSGFTLTSTGGGIFIEGNRTRINGNSVAVDIQIVGDNLQITNNGVHPQESLNGVYIAGNLCNVAKNQVVGAIYVGGKNNLVTSNDVTGTIGISANSSMIQNNKLHDSSGYITISGYDNIVSKNIIEKHAVGLKATGSGNTFLLNEVTRCGMAVAPGVGNVFYGNYFSKNAWILSNMGDAAQQGNGSVLYHNNFVDNYNYELAVSIDSAEKCRFDNGKEGNYWSDYQGTDSDGDGIGDTPYSLDSAHKDNYPLMAPYDLADVSEVTFEWLKTSTLHLISPTETLYADEDVPLYFVTEGKTQGYSYSLDGQDMTRIDGNTTLPRLNEGQHNVTVFAVDDVGNSVASQTVTFTVTSPIQAGIDSFYPTFWAIVLGSIVAAVLVGALLYKRRKNKKEKKLTCPVLGGGKLCSQRTPQTCFQLGI